MAVKLHSENSKKHDHDSPCKHTLLFCTPFDEVYCTTCEEVFTSVPCELQHTNWTWTTTPDFSTGTDNVPYTITTAYPDTIGDIIVTNDVGTHSEH